MPGIDPTRTKVLRNRYSSAMGRRFAKVRRDIRVTVVDNDALGLRTSAPPGTIERLLGNVAAPPLAFDFPTLDAKLEAFMVWLREQIDAEILEVRSRDGQEILEHSEWQNLFIEPAYRKGIIDARIRLRARGVPAPLPDAAIAGTFDAAVHAERLALLFTRNFAGLRDITAAMDAQISAALADGLTRGLGAEAVTRLLTQRVDGLLRTRARVLARTEIIRAHAEGTLNELEVLGVEQVKADVEFVTAQDRRVCVRCLRLEGRIFSLAEARGIIPVHPRCRCSWVPANVGETAADRRNRAARRRRARERIAELAA